MNNFVRNALDDTTIEDTISKLLSRTGSARGAGARVASPKYVPAGNDAKNVAMIGANTAPQADAHYTQGEAAETARDDGSHMPVVDDKYIDINGYTKDPEWQNWDRKQNDAINSTEHGGGFWGWATGGASNVENMRTAELAGYKKAEIERRYRDALTVRAAAQEQFDYSQAKPEYNRNTGVWEQVVTGNRGGHKSLGPTTGPIKEYVDQYGRQGSYEFRPGTTPMVTKPNTPFKSESVESDSPDAAAFAGGKAEGYPAMEPLGEKPETLAKIKEAEAAAKAHDAVAAYNATRANEPDLMGVSPGETVIDKKTGKPKFTAPMTPVQKGEGGKHASDTVNILNTMKEAADQAQKSLTTAESESKDKQKILEERTAAIFDRLMTAQTGEKPASASPAQPAAPTQFKPGTRTKVSMSDLMK